jgi:hypothetical protein
MNQTEGFVRTMMAALRACILALIGVSPALLHTQPAAAQDAFYQATESEIAGPAGSVIRKEPRLGAQQRGKSPDRHSDVHLTRVVRWPCPPLNH